MMNAARINTLVGKEFLDLARNRTALVPVVIVTVPTLTEHAPEAPIATGSPDEAVAATEKVALNTAVAGAACVTVIV